MTTFLFWNVKRKPLAKRIARIAAAHSVDVIILAECDLEPDELLEELRVATTWQYVKPFSLCEKITIYANVPDRCLQEELASSRFTIRSLRLPGLDEILLAAAHLPSKEHERDVSQILDCVRLADKIRSIEERIGHSRTVLVGDLNVDPFEIGMISAEGLHGVMTRNIAQRGQRTIQGERFPFFYNPMWSRLGDESVGPPGTYYDARSEQVCFFWNTFDQVLIRPDLLSRFRNNDLEVLTNDGEHNLLKSNGLPDDTNGSDHLPILFKLHL